MTTSDMVQDLANKLYPMGRTKLLSIFINKVLLKHCYIHPYIYTFSASIKGKWLQHRLINYPFTRKVC